MILSLTAPFSSLALRRAVVAVCALAFLIVSMAHCLNHVEGKSSLDVAQASTAYELSVDLSDDSSTPAKAAAVADHCHGCTMIAVMSADHVLAELVVAPVFDETRLDGIQPHPPTAENPPPIRTI